MVLHDCPLWRNDAIGRGLTREEVSIVVRDFVSSGHGEWEDPESRTRCRILWRRPEQLASDVYDWAVANGYVNSVCTVYELHSGEWRKLLLLFVSIYAFCSFRIIDMKNVTQPSTYRGRCERYVVSGSRRGTATEGIGNIGRSGEMHNVSGGDVVGRWNQIFLLTNAHNTTVNMTLQYTTCTADVIIRILCCGIGCV